MGNNASENNIADTNKKIEAIIRSIAVKHGIALGQNDPILILHTLNELLITELAQKQEELIQQFQVSLEEAADLWNKNMEIKVAEILGEMRSSHLGQINRLIENQIPIIAASISDKFNDRTEPELRRTHHFIKSLSVQFKLMKRLVYLNIAGSILAIIILISIGYMYTSTS